MQTCFTIAAWKHDHSLIFMCSNLQTDTHILKKKTKENTKRVTHIVSFLSVFLFDFCCPLISPDHWPKAAAAEASKRLSDHTGVSYRWNMPQYAPCFLWLNCHELGVSRVSAQMPTYTDCGFGSASQSSKTELILQLYVNQELRSSLIPPTSKALTKPAEPPHSWTTHRECRSLQVSKPQSNDWSSIPNPQATWTWRITKWEKTNQVPVEALSSEDVWAMYPKP